jgi:hypothetical protein
MLMDVKILMDMKMLWEGIRGWIEDAYGCEDVCILYSREREVKMCGRRCDQETGGDMQLPKRAMQLSKRSL